MRRNGRRARAGLCIAEARHMQIRRKVNRKRATPQQIAVFSPEIEPDPDFRKPASRAEEDIISIYVESIGKFSLPQADRYMTGLKSVIYPCFDTFSLRESVSASLENALGHKLIKGVPVFVWG